MRGLSRQASYDPDMEAPDYREVQKAKMPPGTVVRPIEDILKELRDTEGDDETDLRDLRRRRNRRN